MPSELTTQQLDEIQARHQAATPGPWTVSEDYADVLDAEGHHLASFWGQPVGEFIAHAREDVPALIAEIRRLHEPAEPSRYLEDGSTHTVQALTDAGESCVQQACTAAREEARLRQEQYTLRTEVENVLDEVGHMADDERLTADTAAELRRLLRSALGLDRPLT